MSVTISRILHAGYIFEHQGTEIFFDPIFENPFSKNCYAFPEVQFDLSEISQLKPDAIFISHYHDDHCSFDSLNFLDRNTPIYMYCVHEEIFQWLKELGFRQVYQLTLDQPIRVGSFVVTPRRALDANVDSLLQIQVDGLNILNVVDSWIDDETMLNLGKQNWDLVLWPFQTMREMEVLSPRRHLNELPEIPKEWLSQITSLKPRFLVPSSCQFRMESGSWYNQAFFPISYRFFSNGVRRQNPEIEVIRMNPGESFVLDEKEFKKTASLPWIRPLGDQNVDYDYEASLSPPSTQQIAQHLGPLDEAKMQRLIIFCQSDILRKYQEVGPSSDRYFQKIRTWQLSLFTHEGEEMVFYYRIHESHLEPIRTKPDVIEWITEIPAVKLDAALFEGESLTSLYVRINDHPFSETIEKQLAETDFIEDPLLRCLFNRSFGIYQKAQLQRLKSLRSV